MADHESESSDEEKAPKESKQTSAEKYEKYASQGSDYHKEIEAEEKQKQTRILTFLDEINSGMLKNEKLIRCAQFKEQANIPFCQKSNSPKEELVLEHVMQFKRQFPIQFDDHRELYLYPKNECDVFKFICTTIKPTKLGFQELQDHTVCAQCLSLFLNYEELEDPMSFPKVIPSPTNVLEWQKGDCFDFAIVLASLLIGVDYDAYVCYGSAPRGITTKNQSTMPCPFLNEGEKKVEVKKETELETTQKNEFTIQKKPEVVSKFDKNKEMKEKYDEEQRRIKAFTIDDDEPDELTFDPYEGKRLHCWVLLRKGKREVSKNCFIEPTTGHVQPIEYCPYYTIDSIFNHQNFWVNLNVNQPIKELDFDNMEAPKWAQIMYDNTAKRKKSGEVDIEDPHAESKMYMDQKNGKSELGILDMPPPWPPKLFIDKDKFIQLSLLGEYTAFFEKSRVDTYAEYSQPDGLVKRILIQEDQRRLKIKEIRQFQKHRSDKLVLRKRYPFEFKTIEEQDPGKMPHWKKITIIDRREYVIEFQPNRNHDGLIMRKEIIGEKTGKTMEFYQNRLNDNVIYRSVTFIPKDENTKAQKDHYPFDDRHIGNICVN